MKKHTNFVLNSYDETYFGTKGVYTTYRLIQPFGHFPNTFLLSQQFVVPNSNPIQTVPIHSNSHKNSVKVAHFDEKNSLSPILLAFS